MNDNTDKRFRVITLYPDSRFAIGSLLEWDAKRERFANSIGHTPDHEKLFPPFGVEHPEHYPVIFEEVK